MTGTLLLGAGAAWSYLAPTAIGGSTTYVVTSGISMQPRFHSGDLALVRPATRYHVGEIAAYRSSLLHVIVLHRIVAIHDGHYTFKGDNNHFLDPTRPTRAQMLGRLWMRIPHGGEVISWLHQPLTGAMLAGGLALLWLLGDAQRRRRRGRRRRERASTTAPARAPAVKTSATRSAPSVDPAALLSGCVVAVLLCGSLAAVALTHPLTTTITRRLPYLQKLSFSYRAATHPGPVYPSGTITTGQPVFISLAHRVRIDASYSFSTQVPASLAGTEALSMRLTGPTGWSRTIALLPPRPFTGQHATATAMLDLAAIESLLAQVQRMTGAPPGSDYGVAVTATVHVRGMVAHVPVRAVFAPAADFELSPLALQPGSSAPGQQSTGLNSASAGSVSVSAVAPARVGVASVALTVGRLRLLALAGLALSLLATGLFAIVLRRYRAFDEVARIQGRYGHLLVPIAPAEDLGWPPIDVGSIRALAKLAGCSGQLILHSRSRDADVYMVNDQGTVYRYCAKRTRVVWGEWSESPQRHAARRGLQPD
ncbi:MAG: S24/S26 family peptidase [Solirubrobacteraceae bacterium]